MIQSPRPGTNAATKADAIRRVGVIREELEALKAENILVLDMHDIADFTDYFVIATVRSVAQMRALGRRIYEHLKAAGEMPVAPIEDESPRWTILDYGDIIVHLFDPEARELYRLEELWGDAETVAAPPAEA